MPTLPPPPLCNCTSATTIDGRAVSIIIKLIVFSIATNNEWIHTFPLNLNCCDFGEQLSANNSTKHDGILVSRCGGGPSIVGYRQKIVMSIVFLLSFLRAADGGRCGSARLA